MGSRGGAAAVDWPEHVVRLVPELAVEVSMRAPAWMRDEVASAAALAMWEAWAELGVRSTAGLRLVGRKAAGRAFRGAVYGCNEWAALRLVESVPAPARLDTTAEEEGWAPVGPRSGEPAAAQLGPVLARLVELLARSGMDRAAACHAVGLVADLAADVGVHAIYNGASADIAERTGLDRRSCRALVVLMIGQPRARNGGPHPGLVERAARGSDVWADPRVRDLVEEVVRPRRSFMRGAWASREVLASVGLHTCTPADDTRSALK